MYSSQGMLERMSIKIHDKRPDELPVAMASRLREWLAQSSAQLVQVGP